MDSLLTGTLADVEKVTFQFHWMDSYNICVNKAADHFKIPLSIPLNGFSSAIRLTSSASALRPFNSIEWIHVTLDPNIHTYYTHFFFQFHWMDSSIYIIPRSSGRVFLTFNSIEWIRELLVKARLQQLRSFNSIEWIRRSRTTCCGMPVTRSFQFHWMDSYRHTNRSIRHRPSILSIPLNGFTSGAPAVNTGSSNASFQFHWMDSRHLPRHVAEATSL